MKKVLVVGSGAREHAIAKTFLRSPQVDQVFVAPGNDGMRMTPNIKLVPISVQMIRDLADFAELERIDLTFVGSEEPLTLGIVDYFEQHDLPIFGPRQAAAQLEGSKTFAKELMAKYHIPTAQSVTVKSLDEALLAVERFGLPIVIKQDGLALGKGVQIFQRNDQLMQQLTGIYAKAPHATLVVEEYLEGVEFSIFSFVGQNGIVHAPIAQDHKRLLDGDEGPNTGGMGAYSPVPWLADDVRMTAIEKLVMPTIEGMKADGIPFYGILYTGVMLTKQGPKVIEFNVRLGDPETQVVLPQLNSDFYIMIDELMLGIQPQVTWQHHQVYIGVVLAGEKYPASGSQGITVPVLENHQVKVDSAALTLKDDAYVSDGGRLLTFVAAGETVSQAQEIIYSQLQTLDLKHFQYRTDIGYQAVNHEVTKI
ncbi:phosphoribosylamine--glycine ligase [Weissella diestrammenae]|uniref:Phosphoribosylamine--glycine ligase n=1 Tax=Weissella diestrammenae TaxID=1162633 RepID=A0A7G9T457_9LACO|nr:phosphoribosylamine--glycine ligase [Weissella diestrammenae]MCM0583405.1 phosphoribosylamine--glycine ligase [Weissella diestrammenae]QNN74882.1 phosphoribosylamine--glycine ligase [Weissella diestrammenae]